jgi:acid stress-induced BolA-like protein IbaG/YrbA
MKLTDTFSGCLKQHFSEIYVYDRKGDGHFVQMIAIDTAFEEKSLVERSRMIFIALGDMKKKVHAYSVRGFTPGEWREKKDSFSLMEYTHIP